MKAPIFFTPAILVLILLLSVPRYSFSQHSDTTKKATPNTQIQKEQNKNNGSPNDWKKYWGVFIKELISETGGTAGEKSSDKVRARFGNKEVTWEGEIENQFTSGGSATTIKMQPDINTPGLNVTVGNYTGAAAVLLHLKPATSQVSEWVKLPVGAKVKFTAKVSDIVYLTMASTVNIMVNSAEIIK